MVLGLIPILVGRLALSGAAMAVMVIAALVAGFLVIHSPGKTAFLVAVPGLLVAFGRFAYDALNGNIEPPLVMVIFTLIFSGVVYVGLVAVLTHLGAGLALRRHG